MIQLVEEKRAIAERDVDFEYDGHWVLLDEREFPESEFSGYVVAYGDGTPEDRDALDRINFDRYRGKALLLKGYAPKPGEHDCYGVYDS